MNLAIDYLWLQPARTDTDEGFRGRVADPVWFVARQWQLGELQGEDASSPVRVELETSHAPITYDRARPELDPTNVPAEALLEAEPGDWWTFGRRIRIGRLTEAPLRQKYPGESAAFFDRLRLRELPDPYTEFEADFDGAAVFASGVLAGHQMWDELGVPSPPADHWSSARLCYDAQMYCGGTRLAIREHDGGDVDWFTVDGDGPSPILGRPAARYRREVLPSRFTFPGAPHPRWWQIEDHALDIGGFPPDRSHLGTMLLHDVAVAHTDDWFWFPVPRPDEVPLPDDEPNDAPSCGVVVSLRGVRVWDSFDKNWSLTPPAPTDWALFHTAGLAAGDVVVWPVAVAPQSGPVLDDVALGVDEDANLAWAVELRADGSQLLADTSTADAMRELTRTGTRNFTYRPSTTLPPHWHPYERVRDTDEDAPEGSGDGLSGPYRQGIVADLTGPVPRPRPGPNSRMIGGPSGPGAGRGHTVDANALPSTGARLQRRTKLARAADGSPVLWVERRITPLLGPPTSHLRFDVTTEASPEGVANG